MRNTKGDSKRYHHNVPLFVISGRAIIAVYGRLNVKYQFSINCNQYSHYLFPIIISRLASTDMLKHTHIHWKSIDNTHTSMSSSGISSLYVTHHPVWVYQGPPFIGSTEWTATQFSGDRRDHPRRYRDTSPHGTVTPDKNANAVCWQCGRSTPPNNERL